MTVLNISLICPIVYGCTFTFKPVGPIARSAVEMAHRQHVFILGGPIDRSRNGWERMTPSNLLNGDRQCKGTNLSHS